MRIIKLIGAVLALGLIFGCAESHTTPPTVYYTEPTPAIAPTSTRPDVRVYSPMAPSVPRESFPATAGPPVGNPDVALGQSISQLLKGDPYLSGISRNVEATIRGGVVTLRGSVPTENDRQRIKDQISRVPGVLRVDDDLGIDLK
jgi:Predicted periplasmic or secreted lipoprotein